MVRSNHNCGIWKESGMRLNIKNFSKIKDASILVDGITVIAGENNTGKSTVGKILFSLFNSVANMEENIEKQRRAEIQESCRMALRNYDAHGDTYRIRQLSFYRKTAQEIADHISRIQERQGQILPEQVYTVLEDTLEVLFERNRKSEYQALLLDLLKNIMNILDLPEKAISLELLTRYFDSIFSGQINSLIEQDLDAFLELNIKDKNIILSFQDNKCFDYQSSISLINKAVYIDNPFIIDRLNSFSDLNSIDSHLRNLLLYQREENANYGVIESVLAKEKLNEIFQTLQKVVDGKIVVKKDEEFYLEKEGFYQPVSFSNLSTGLKSFVILKMLLEKGLLLEKDVLILDEPEVHLHPQWQIVYAELIVLLQKYFDLSIVVTTHSPYFLDALNLFSVKHGFGEKVNYYLSAMDHDYVKIECVTDHIDSIYERMASPIQMLDSLRYELNNG